MISERPPCHSTCIRQSIQKQWLRDFAWSIRARSENPVYFHVYADGQISVEVPNAFVCNDLLSRAPHLAPSDPGEARRSPHLLSIQLSNARVPTPKQPMLFYPCQKCKPAARRAWQVSRSMFRGSHHLADGQCTSNPGRHGSQRYQPTDSTTLATCRQQQKRQTLTSAPSNERTRLRPQ